MTVQEHDANNIRDAEASTEEPVAADRRAARSLSALLLLAFLAAALLFVAGAMGVLFVDLIQLIPAQTEELIATTALHGGVALVAAIMYAWSHRLQRVASLWPRLMLAVLVVYGALTVDRGLAVVYPRPDKHVPILTRHATRLWYHRRSAAGFGSGCYIHTNSLGFRGQETPPKVNGERRVLMVGDSITFGFVLKDDETIPRQVERFINEATNDDDVRCINAGVSGYTTWQERDLLENEGLDTQPDVVVVQFCINDMIGIIGIGRGNPMTDEMDFSLNQSSHWSGIWRALSYHAAHREHQELADRQRWAQHDPTADSDATGLHEIEDIYDNPPVPAVKAAWELCLEDLTGIKHRCDDIDIPMVLVYSPDTVEFGDDPKYRQPSNILRGWAEEHGVPFVDITPIWQDAIANGGPADDMFYDAIHPKPYAAKLMAKAIADVVMDELKVARR